MTIADWAARLRSRYVPDHVVGEVLGRRWTDNAIPVPLLIALAIFHGDDDSEFPSVGNLSDTSRQIGEFGLMVIGMTIVMLAGGIDLSVGSTFALANFTALALINVAKWPIEVAIVATMALGALVGLMNGFLIGYLQAAGVSDDARHADADARDRRPFCCRSIRCGSPRAMWTPTRGTSSAPDRSWAFPSVSCVLIVIAIAAHVILTRLRIGWRITAVGGSRRASYNAGIPCARTVCLTYVVSGLWPGSPACSMRRGFPALVRTPASASNSRW